LCPGERAWNPSLLTLRFVMLRSDPAGHRWVRSRLRRLKARVSEMVVLADALRRINEP
jgi:hypothetical protein